MILSSKILRKCRAFEADESGNAAIELVLCVPILMWCLLSTAVYFDAYRAESISTRAGLTIADMYSRENDPVGPTYLSNTRSVLQALTEAEDEPDIRVTVYFFDDADNDYKVVWSQNEGMTPNHDDASLALLTDQLPVMADGDRAILVETRTQYTAPFSVTLTPFASSTSGAIEFDTFTVISPRFASSVCWKNSSSSAELC